MITLKLLAWLLPITGNVIADRKGRKPHYLVMFIFRGWAALLHGILMYPHADWRDGLTPFIPLFIFQITSYWILFELALNIVQDRPLLYHDTREKDSGWIDQFFAWAGKESHTAAKALALICMIGALIFIYYRA
jgi:hypothetical protein